ncbi:hypothetical protein IW492_08900 [Enterococcus sp. BWB1-3]|uniref:hypothetical protein n=1 Tax=Enterococcus sp. BWB1-3 TaxID=2787713 RepID=UPI001923407E|nr:hypothetical protein [Enterococcus sp. BWB1-3]MBL1229347.1 hypothetical protein [Enterococcus sp. BWB1-3]
MNEDNRITEGQLAYHMKRYRTISIQAVAGFSVMLVFFMGLWTTIPFIIFMLVGRAWFLKQYERNIRDTREIVKDE